MIDAVRAGEEVPQTKEETRKRWDRYAQFAERTFNVEIPAIPYEQLEELDDEGQVKFVLDAVQQSGVQIPGGHHRAPAHVVSGQPGASRPSRSSLTTVMSPSTWPIATTMTSSSSSRGMRSASPTAAGASIVADLEVVPIGGEHIQAIDEPIIAKVGRHMSRGAE